MSCGAEQVVQFWKKQGGLVDSRANVDTIPNSYTNHSRTVNSNTNINTTLLSDMNQDGLSISKTLVLTRIL